jgi:A/G-specific adenine glycosylase
MMTIDQFKKTVYAYYEKEGRTFPWRTDTRPWGIMVSEFMLQQTQTDRVIPYWEHWMKKWPEPAGLAAAGMDEALREWSGLGYNRRCRFLKDCARYITQHHDGRVPETPYKLLDLPGIGQYTAGAIACFAYNYPSAFIETNIRSAFIHCFFGDKTGVHDREIFPLLKETLDRENPRLWYWALMDYGVFLKRTAENPGRRSAGYAQQGKFEGSFRQLRGTVIRSLSGSGRGNAGEIEVRTGIKMEDLLEVLEVLKKDSLVAEEEGIYRIKE